VRGTIGNVLVWGIGWTMLGFVATMLLRITGVVDAPVSVPDALGIGLKIGLGGGIAGTAFSAFITFAYRHRRIQDISWWRFGVGGAVVTAASITAFVQGASLLSGSGLVPWRYQQSTLAMFALFGFGIAALSVKLAQLAPSRASDGGDALLEGTPDARLDVGAGAVPWERQVGSQVHVQRD